MKILPYILKTLWRHRSRTFLTVLGTAIGLFVFCFVGSVQEGMDDLQQRQSDKRSLVAFQANKFCPATSHLPQDYTEKIMDLDGIRDVVPIQVFTNNCRASLDVVVFYGVPPEKLQVARGDFELIDGDWADFTEHQDAAVVGSSVAKRRQIKTGDKFSIGSLSVQVAGIFEADDPAEQNYIYSHLDFLQRNEGMDLTGTVTQLEILLEGQTDAEQVCRDVDTMFRAGPVETDTRPKGVFQARSLGDLTQMISLAGYLGLACVGLVLALVATTTVMSVQDRIKEHAVLQTLGYSGGKVFSMVLIESLLLSLIGGMVGIGTAMLVLKFSGLAVGAEAVTIAFTPTIGLAMKGAAVAVITGLAAGLFPALHAARTDIVPALRTG